MDLKFGQRISSVVSCNMGVCGVTSPATPPLGYFLLPTQTSFSGGRVSAGLLSVFNTTTKTQLLICKKKEVHYHGKKHEHHGVVVAGGEHHIESSCCFKDHYDMVVDHHYV